jgi:hypothetical protein
VNLVDEVLQAKRDLDVAQAKLDALTAQLPDAPVGTILTGDTGKLRVCGSSRIDPDLLKQRVSASMWTSITERRPVAVLYHAAVRRGKLDQSIIDECTKPTKKWFEKR